MTEIEVAEAGSADAGRLAELHARVFTEAWDRTTFARLLARSGTVAFLARHGTAADAVGFILGRFAADEGEVLSLGVLSVFRRQRIGSRLIAAIAAAARRAEARRLFLEVAADNGAAVSLYGGLGFAEVGRRVGYYPLKGGPAQDALVLSLSL